MIDYSSLPVATMEDVQAMLTGDGTMAGVPKKRFPRETYRAMWRTIRAYVTDKGYEQTMDTLKGYEQTMDTLSNTFTDAEWETLLEWLKVADVVLAEKPEKPLPIIKERVEYTS